MSIAVLLRLKDNVDESTRYTERDQPAFAKREMSLVFFGSRLEGKRHSREKGERNTLELHD